MSEPSFILFKSVQCLETDDLLGRDDLEGRFDNNPTYSISFGRFSAGDTISDLEILVPAIASELYIYDKDLSGDDLIGTILLTDNLDTERELLVSNGSASYQFVFTVFTESTSRKPTPPCEG